MTTKYILDMRTVGVSTYTNFPESYIDFGNEEKYNSDTLFLNVNIKYLELLKQNRVILKSDDEDDVYYEIKFIDYTKYNSESFEVVVLKVGEIRYDR